MSDDNLCDYGALLNMSTYRRSCSADHVHPPLQAGIYGRKADGARSVVLGGGFDEDEDHGDTL